MNITGFVCTDFGWGNRGVLHLDWQPRINSRQISGLQKELRSIDRDAYVLTVYADGLRCINDHTGVAGEEKSWYWRKPLATLQDVLKVCKRFGVRSGRGFWLPLGWECKCPQWLEEEKCEIGDCISCLPDAENIQPEHWFAWSAR